MIDGRSRRLLGGLVILAGTLLVAGAAHAACIGQKGNWVTCPPGVPDKASIIDVTYNLKVPNTTVRIDAPPYVVVIPGAIAVTTTTPDTAKDYGALKFLDYNFRMPDGDMPLGLSWPRFDESAKKAFGEMFGQRLDVQGALIAPPPAIRRADAMTAGVPELLLSGAPPRR